MAITTDSMNAVSSGGVNYDFYGLSKTLNNYTFDEIFEYVFCSSSSNLIYHVGYGSNTMNYYTYEAQDSALGGHVPFQMDYAPVNKNVIHYPLDTPLNQPDGLYMKMIWLQRTSNGSDDFVYTGNAVNYKLITEFNAPHYVYEANTPQKVKEYYGSNSWADGGYMYYSNGGYLYYYDDVTSESPLRINIPRIMPALIFKDANGNGFLVMYKQIIMDFITMRNTESSGWGTPETSAYFPSYDGTVKIAFPLTVELIYQFMNSTTGEMSSPQPDGSYANDGQTGGYSRPFYSLTIKEHLMSIWDFGGSNYYPLGFHQKCYFRTVDECKKFYALAGLHFKADKIYKPIIQDGYVTGYTDILDTPSDLDNWDGKTKHKVPDTPPGPTPPGPGYDDDPWSGVSFSGVGVGGAGAFARCYYMTATELANLRTWMSGVGVPEGFNPMAQIIGLSQVPVALSGDAPETVQFINSSAVYDPGVVSRVVDSGVSTQYSMGKPISYSLGSIDITRRMQERGEPYLDYSCQIELYLPLIGTFSLDTQAVMGRTLEAEAILDPISGTLAAYAWVTRDGQKLPVAYGSTTIGIDLPITAQQYSMSRAAAKQINAQFTASMLSSALTTVTAAAAAGSASSAAAGRAGAASGAGIQPASQFNSYAQSASIAGSQTAISQSGNIFGAFMEWGRAVRQLSYGNNTAIAGSFGGSMAQWSYPFNAYVKIIRPRYEKPRNYNHTQGVPCVQTKTIGSCTGLIQCIGADVSGITRATDLERQAIQAALCNGVYAGGGE